MVSFIETSVTVVGAKKVADKKTKGHIISLVLDYRYRYIPVLQLSSVNTYRHYEMWGCFVISDVLKTAVHYLLMHLQMIRKKRLEYYLLFDGFKIFYQHVLGILIPDSYFLAFTFHYGLIFRCFPIYVIFTT